MGTRTCSCSSRSRSPQRSSSWACLRIALLRTPEAYYDPSVSPAPRGPMKMPKPTEATKAAFAKVVPDGPGITLKPMFGQLSAFVNGNMFCGIFGEELMVRLPAEEIAKVKQQGGKDFEPMAGHKMGGYVVVPGDWRARPPTALIKRALDETRKMPAKTPKKK